MTPESLRRHRCSCTWCTGLWRRGTEFDIKCYHSHALPWLLLYLSLSPYHQTHTARAPSAFYTPTWKVRSSNLSQVSVSPDCKMSRFSSASPCEGWITAAHFPIPAHSAPHTTLHIVCIIVASNHHNKPPPPEPSIKPVNRTTLGSS